MLFRSIRQGAVGSGLSGGLALGFAPSGSGFPTFEIEHFLLTTALSSNGPTKQSSNNTIGLHTLVPSAGNSQAVNFTNPWDMTFIGGSYAETAQTGVTATWSAGVATFAKTAHGYAVGDKIANTTFDRAGYNGTLVAASVPTADSWTAAIASDPGGAGSGGTTSRISNVTLVDYIVEWMQ